MPNVKSLPAILVLLALAGCSTDSPNSESKPESVTVAEAQPMVQSTNIFTPSTASIWVAAAHSDAQYLNGAVWEVLAPNMAFTNGVQLRTGRDSWVDFAIGRVAYLRLSADAELVLPPVDVATMRIVLELRRGTILGYVKRLPQESLFQVHGGELTLEPCGGDFVMEYAGKVGALTGEMTVRLQGKTYQLRTGQCFDPKSYDIGALPRKFLDLNGGAIIFCPPVPPSWPSLSLSPFDRGLENARHGANGTYFGL
jgi:hypothetical protein